jgi:hypothetical protein
VETPRAKRHDFQLNCRLTIAFPGLCGNGLLHAHEDFLKHGAFVTFARPMGFGTIDQPDLAGGATGSEPLVSLSLGWLSRAQQRDQLHLQCRGIGGFDELGGDREDPQDSTAWCRNIPIALKRCNFTFCRHTLFQKGQALQNPAPKVYTLYRGIYIRFQPRVGIESTSGCGRGGGHYYAESLLIRVESGRGELPDINSWPKGRALSANPKVSPCILSLNYMKSGRRASRTVLKEPSGNEQIEFSNFP